MNATQSHTLIELLKDSTLIEVNVMEDGQNVTKKIQDLPGMKIRELLIGLKVPPLTFDAHTPNKTRITELRRQLGGELLAKLVTNNDIMANPNGISVLTLEQPETKASDLELFKHWNH